MDNQPIDQQPTEQNTDPQNTPQPQFNAPESVTPTEPAPVAPPEPVSPPTFTPEPAPIQPPKKSKKKLIIILIIIAILLVGGGTAAMFMLKPKPAAELDKSGSSKSPTPATVSKSDISEVPDTKEYSASEANAKFTIPMGGHYISVKSGYSNFLSFFEGVDNSEEKYIIGIHNFDEISDVENKYINDFLLKPLSGWLSRVISGKDELTKINSEKATKTTVNGFDTLRFEGSANFVDNWDNKEYSVYSVGYAFSVEGVPMQVIGFVVDKSQSQAYKDMVAEDVDKIMNTIRKKD